MADKCRTCKQVSTDLYFIDKNGKPTKRPRCKECHERILRAPKSFEFSDGFIPVSGGFRFRPKPVMEEEAQLEDDARFDYEEIS